MRVARTLPELIAAREALRRRRGALALVPTMGALHAGHMALVNAARATGAGVVASIFVNPLQFAANEDLASYPRDEPGDLRMLEAHGCELAWLPSVATMYPPGSTTTVDVAGIATEWEGRARPGHFRGMATVVAKLFGQARAETAYFGEKDWQQLQVVRRMVADLLLPVDVVGVPTVREADGLALSSRNRYLDARERRLAPSLYEVMQGAATVLRPGADAAGPLAAARDHLAASGFVVDYLTLVEPETLEPVSSAAGPSRLIAAARLGPVRLLDNIPVHGATAWTASSLRFSQ